MQVDVSVLTQERIKTLVERGRFATADEAIESAIEALWMEQDDYDAVLDSLIDEALEDVRVGRIHEMTPGLAQEIRDGGRARLRKRANRPA